MRRGRMTQIARAVHLSPAAVCRWPRIPAERARIISQALGIPLHELRPDLWEPPVSEPAHE